MSASCENPKSSACDICDRVEEGRRGGTRKSIKRKVGDAIEYDHPRRGRPRRSLTSTSLTHNTGRSGGRPRSISKQVEEETKETAEWDVNHQMIDELARAVTPSASSASKERVHGVLHRSPLSVQPKVRASFREKSHCFDKLFVSEKLDLDDVGCKQLIPECPTPPAEEKDIPLCSHCPHEVSYCNDVPKFVADYVTARGRTADEVALIKIGADGGGASLKLML